MARPYRRRAPIADRNAKQPFVLEARGEVSLAERTVISQILGSYGLETQFSTPESYEERFRKRTMVVANPGQVIVPPKEYTGLRFADIEDPDAYLVREHFEDFRNSFGELFGIGRNFVGKVFNAFVDGSGKGIRQWSYNGVPRGDWTRTRTYRDPMPMAGIDVVLRSEAGFEPYPTPLDPYGQNRYCGRFAIRAGSIIDAVQEIEQQPKPTVTQMGMLAVAHQLEFQFKT